VTTQVILKKTQVRTRKNPGWV